MIFHQLTQQLRSLSNLLAILNDEQYSHAIAHLGKASIGGHTRHIIELLQCVINGYATGEVDYVNRVRNHDLETNKSMAQSVLEQLEKQIIHADKQLKFVVEEVEEMQSVAVTTTYFREVVYNTEHAIHHLALIKVALIEMNLDIVNDDFGMAYSTIKYKQAELISKK